ncbi:MAG: dipeptidase [Candidatus Heimdallarchaeaceae archaeon]
MDSIIADIHIHAQDLLPQPFRTIYRFIQRKTYPQPFYIEQAPEAKIDLCVVNAVGDKLVTRMYGFDAFRSVKKQIKRIVTHADNINAIIYKDLSSLEQGIEEERPVIVLAVEGGDIINSRIERIKDLHTLGVKSITLVHFSDNSIGHISTKLSEISKPQKKKNKSSEGLTDFGKKVIEEMNSLSMIIDLAHANKETTMDTIERTNQPVVVSHSGARALQPSFPRYISDEEIKAVTSTDGLIGIWPLYLNNYGTRTIEDFVEHAKYIRSLVGYKHIAIGTDINGLPGIMEDFVYTRDISRLKEVFLNSEFNEEESIGITGKNFVSLLKQFQH